MVQDFPQRIAHVLDKMEAVGDLDGVRSTGTCCIGISRGSVTGDHFDPRMLLEPLHQRLRLAAVQNVDGSALFQVAEDRAISVAPPKREVIDSEHPGG